jgi:hypothetical protein
LTVQKKSWYAHRTTAYHHSVVHGKLFYVESKGKMTVASASPLPSGDVEATKPETSDLRRQPPSLWSPLPEHQVVGGSRFWALAGDSSEEEEDVGDVGRFF